jgi:hypothetical protein
MDQLLDETPAVSGLVAAPARNVFAAYSTASRMCK